ncbi:Sodium-independent sulfate anion transporter [Harpegnathos saltator]|uniref:Sodium-independent sulfate anion transporter n=1 Tax=Harpegnathos saltator TaxID=610380 RepID=E2C6F9_HARSA|nr:Sodium-independent sulfate anion transporter [Harpegnathos saltator]
MSTTAKVSGVDAECLQSTERKCRFMPIFGWLPRYNRTKAISDLIAGITLGLTMIPQSIAYAALAGLTAQLQGLLGLQYKSANIVDNLYKLCANIGNTRLPDLALGICSILFLLLFRSLKDINCPCTGDKRNPSKNVLMKKVLWYFSIGRNAIIVFITTTIAYQLETTTGSAPFRLSGKIESGLPTISLPPFSAQVGNRTYTFLDMCSHYGSGIVILPLISVLANVAIAKAFAKGANVNATQEMLTLGLCNIIGSFVSSMPTAGAFTRSAVSSASGIQTSMAGLYSGTMTLLALSFLTPYFYYIPRATLAAVLITAVIFMIDLRIIKLLWKGCKTDAVAVAGTFLICIFVNVEIGLLLGIVYNLVFFIRPSARPTIQVVHRKTDLGIRYIMLELDTYLSYPAMTFFINKVMNLARNEEDDVPLIVNCERFVNIDYTTMKGIEMLSITLNRKQDRFWLLHLKSNIVNCINVLVDNKYIRLIGNEENITNVLHNNTLSSRQFENSINIRSKKVEEVKNSNQENFSNPHLQPKDSEVIAEEMIVMLSGESKLQ